MKKLIVSVALLLSVNVVLSQTTERKKLYEGDFSITMSIKNSDTSTYFSYTYQNMKYQHISDLGIIILFNKKDLVDFVNNLKSFSEKESGVVINYHHKYFDLNLHDFSKNIFITDSKGKYTSITKNKAIKLCEEIEGQIHLLK